MFVRSFAWSCARLGIAASVLVCAAVAGCAGTPSGASHAEPSHEPSPPPSQCAADPDHPWVTGADRACERDLDCTVVVAAQCAMFAVSARAAERVSSGDYACPPLPTGAGCMCAVPGMEPRCHHGCCQKRFAGTDGPWLPVDGESAQPREAP